MKRFHAKLGDVWCGMIFYCAVEPSNVEFGKVKSPRSGRVKRGGSCSCSRVIGLRDQIFQSRERTVGFAADEYRTAIERHQSHARHASSQSCAGVRDNELIHAEQRDIRAGRLHEQIAHLHRGVRDIEFQR